ncbi:adenylyl cyclase [Frondihabitans sp. 762G35]|uniref:adenylyl cyclase n=1 Tax=Frondihabitans sp. 762G35 TaxID=1446794 RepID=UPI000E7061B7|nr:adenylyl cyclase [Frondihabitans sp. 762G35]
MKSIRSRRAVVVLAAFALGVTSVTGLASAASAAPTAAHPTSAAPTSAAPAASTKQHPVSDPRRQDLGPNVVVFDPSMPIADIQARVDAIAAQQVDSEEGTGRYALLFEPGVYGTPTNPLVFQVGYYTEVAGLGQSPKDVTINGQVDVFNRCLTADNCIALDNFWRSMSNLTIAPAGGTGCRANTEFWAVSQASPLRRVDIVGGPLTFMDYCTAGPQYASGGFFADSRAGAVTNGSQQQFLTRDSQVGSWSNGVWNQVFSGVVGAPAQSFPTPPYTTLAATPASKEKPYLYLDQKGAWRVFVPTARTNSSGTTWAAGQTPGRSLSLDSFYVAKPTDSASTIGRQVARGKNLLLTPGVYSIDRSIRIDRANTVVLGLGLATLTAERGSTPIVVGNVPGVDIAGIMIDAGSVNSRSLLQVGSDRGRDDHGRDDHGKKGSDGRGHDDHSSSASNPTALQDVFFRIGGPHVGKATTSLVVNSSHVILDDIWAWRADHGNGVGWTVNTADTGVVVNGDDVTATGLFVEHYQKDNVVWNGERGITIFFQNELPYDAPNQAAWQHDGILGYAGYKVSDRVKTHTLWGGGSYIFTNVDPTIHATHGFEVPVTPGVQLHDLLTVNLGAGTLDHVVNDTGAPATTQAVGTPVSLVSGP